MNTEQEGAPSPLEKVIEGCERAVAFLNEQAIFRNDAKAEAQEYEEALAALEEESVEDSAQKVELLLDHIEEATKYFRGDDLLAERNDVK